MKFEVTVALIDDRKVAHDFILKCFLDGSPLPPEDTDVVRESVCLARDFRLRFTEATEPKIREALSRYKGPLLLFLDLELGFDREKRQAIVADLEQRIRETDAVGTASARAYLKSLREDNSLLPYVDGLSIALDAILNPSISPLSIKLATTGKAGAGESVVVLKTLGSKYRSTDCFFVDNNPGGLPFSQAEGFLSLAQAWGGIIQPSVKEIRTSIPKCSSRPEHRLEDYLAWIAGRHDDLGKYSHTSEFEAFIAPHLIALLGITEDDWREQIWPNLKKVSGQGAHFLKRTGTSLRETLCVSGGWLLALAAFQALQIPRPWQKVFTPEDLFGQPDGWESFHLTPTFSVPSVHEAMRRFFRLCLRLFEADKAETGPLIKVTLSLSGLEFLLDFDAWNPPKECLVSRLLKWRDGYLKRESGYSWNSELSDGHGTSRALWDWWLMTSLDEDFSLEYAASEVFNVDTYWRIRLRRTQEGQTKVVFCE